MLKSTGNIAEGNFLELSHLLKLVAFVIDYFWYFSIDRELWSSMMIIADLLTFGLKWEDWIDGKCFSSLQCIKRYKETAKYNYLAVLFPLRDEMESWFLLCSCLAL